MAENCRVSNCFEKYDYVCTCNPEIYMCLPHMIDHINEPGRNHRLTILSEAHSALRAKAIQKAEVLDLKVGEAYRQGGQMIQEIIEGMNSFSGNVSSRQQHLIELANSGKYSPEIDREVMETGNITANLGSGEDFRRFVQSNFSVEDGDYENNLANQEINALAGYLGQCHGSIIKVLKYQRDENREIRNEIGKLKAENRVQGSSAQIEAVENSLKQTCNELKLRIISLEKQNQEQKTEILNIKNSYGSVQNAFYAESDQMKKSVKEISLLNKKTKEESQKAINELQDQLQGLQKIGVSSPSFQISEEAKLNFLRIDNKMNNIKKQINDVGMITQEYKRKQDLLEAKEKANRERELKEKEEERIRRIPAEVAVSRNIKTETTALETEFKAVKTELDGQFQTMKGFGRIGQDIIDNITKKVPNYSPTPNEKEAEFKRIYEKITTSIATLENINNDLQNIFDSPLTAGDISARNQEFQNMNIPQLKVDLASCKSLVGFLKLNIGRNWYHQSFPQSTIKINKDSTLYFFCN